MLNGHKNVGDIMKFTRTITVLLVVLISSQYAWADEQKITVDPATVLSTLDKSHPRLMLKDRDLQDLKKQYAEDKVLQKCVADVLRSAQGYLKKPKLTYKIPGLLLVSRECLQRIHALGLAWRWTGQEKYARKAKENLLTVCGFKDWNPSHFLDTAEMSYAVGVGYDWLYSYLDRNSRELIRKGLIKNGMEAGLRAYEKGKGWPKRKNNWNLVCNSGLIIGALAIAETDPQYAERIIPAALKSLPLALKSYGPDGAWLEGPGYWHYATQYTAYGMTALETALGKDFGLLGIDGVSEAGLFPIYSTGPTGMYLNFADCGGRSSRQPISCMFWLARTFGNVLYAESEHAQLAWNKAAVEHLIWYVPKPTKKAPGKSLDKYFRGKVEIALLRSSWDDPEALWVGVKAGYNQVNHGHLDLGNFEMDALGVRWACELGSDDYNLPGYWGRKRGSKRWSYYRLSSFSHNVPLLGNQSQDPFGEAKFIKFESNKTTPFVLIDLTSAYKDYARKAVRGVGLAGNRRAVLVQDEFEIENPCEVAWGMITKAKITVRKNGLAELTLKDKKLLAQVLAPAGVNFSIESAEQEPPQSANKGYSRLMVRLPNQKGNVRVAILLSPVWQDGRVIKTIEVKPLTQW